MSDLTELYIKEKLESGWYYIQHAKFETHTIDYLYPTNEWKFSDKKGVVRVLAKVPTYDEFRNQENYIEFLKRELGERK
ncbi:MAG: hypothetical protein UE295_06555 [Acutalibacteraceae bacterium]|nr:hypothetical protein [Acutalibacteraceae bacterium]